MRLNGDGHSHRGKADLLPRSWLALDLDGGSREECDLMLLRLAHYLAVAWTTARSTPECPRVRILVALNRLVDGPEGERAIEVEPGPVLYLALEDTKRRLTKRLRILCGDTIPPPEQIEFLTDCPRLGSGGEEVLRAWLRDHPTARLVVIDTLPRFRPPMNAKENPLRQ